MKKRIGIIGFGEMGKRHGLEFREATQGLIELAGVVEPDDAMYRRGCEWNNMQPPRYASVGELLAKASLDGALITSPNHTHNQNLREFKGLEIPVLVEKPLDTNVESVAELVRFAASYKGKIIVDHVMRYAPIIRRARQLVEEGKLGRLASFQFEHREECGPFHTFRRTRKTGGGQMIEKATHDLDVMLYLFDSTPKRVSMIARQQSCGGDKPNDLHCPACGERLTCPSAHWGSNTDTEGLKDIARSNDLCVHAKEMDVADNEVSLIELSSGAFGTYSQSFFCHMNGHSRIYKVLGAEGAMCVTLSAEDPGYRGLIHYYPRDRSGEQEVFSYEYFNKIHYNGGPYVARHFLDLMRGAETTPFTTVNQAFVAEALGFAAMKSADEEQQFVKVEAVVPDDLKQIYASTYRN